ncbi:Fur family transcriptional regulator [Alkaliphilus serpentinus]|uniref:Transcriptional repressor n=1 Tax=Alkaliphilus serpentinus TaxID=1482731 RepID=A0A833HMK3_9FIRM|nr:Fur family transcriptional regulator [Alkaliphilus serpentinus]KAB3527690.1 transcriptional repressor [Alkaliphilus serpentinus]
MNFLDYLRNKGYKITAHRKAIIEIFNSNPLRLYTASEVLEEILKKGHSINFSTVYRNLEVLEDAGIIRRSNLNNGINYYEINGEDHHHHLICLGCGNTSTTGYCPAEEIKLAVRDSNFTPVDHKFEIYGYCKKCKKE